MTIAGVAALRAEVDALAADVDLATLRPRFAEVLGSDPGGPFPVVAEEAIARLEGLQVPVAGDLLRDFGGEGKHPTHLWADGLVFRTMVVRCFVHGGRVHDDSVGPATAWVASALPQVACGLHAALDRPVALRIGRTISLWRVGASVAVGHGSGSVAATATIDPEDLLRVVAGHAGWRSVAVDLHGDRVLAEAVLDQLRLPADGPDAQGRR